MKKELSLVLGLVLLFIVAATQAWAVTTYRYSDDVTNLRGDVIGGAYIYVYDANTTNLSSLYLYPTTATSKANPTYTDTNGRFFFYAAPGIYDVKIIGDGITTYTIEDVVLNPYDTITGVFNVVAYGALGDGTTDDTAAIQAAIDAAEAAGSGKIFFPADEYYLTAGIQIEQTDQFGSIEVEATGAVFKFNTGIGTALVILGNASTRSYGINWRGGKVWFGDAATTVDRDSTVGFQILNGSSCRLRDFTVMNCEVGVQLKAINAGGVSYNTIEPQEIINCITAISYVHSGATSWVTENICIGGKILYTSALVSVADTVDCSGGAALYMRGEDSADQHSDQNKFYGTSFELADASIATADQPDLMDIEGRYHLFSGIRYEGWDTGTNAGNIPYIAIDDSTGGTTSYGNMFIGGRAYRWKDAMDEDSLRLCVALAGADSYFSGIPTASNPIMILRNGGPNSTVNVFAIRDSVGVNTYEISSKGAVTAGNDTTDAYVKRMYGPNSPEGVYTAPIGSTFQRTDAAPGLYSKSSGTGNTGWEIVSTSASEYAFGYLPDSTTVFCTTADTFYAVTGTFTMDPLQGFSIPNNSLVYDGASTKYVEIDWEASAANSSNSQEIHFGISHNLQVPIGEHGIRFPATTGVEYCSSGSVVYSMAPGDSLTFEVNSDGAGEDVYILHFTATVHALQ